MKTLAELYPDPETWSSGRNHKEAIRLRQERMEAEFGQSEDENINRQKLEDTLQLNMSNEKLLEDK